MEETYYWYLSSSVAKHAHHISPVNHGHLVHLIAALICAAWSEEVPVANEQDENTGLLLSSAEVCFYPCNWFNSALALSLLLSTSVPKQSSSIIEHGKKKHHSWILCQQEHRACEMFSSSKSKWLDMWEFSCCLIFGKMFLSCLCISCASVCSTFLYTLLNLCGMMIDTFTMCGSTLLF